MENIDHVPANSRKFNRILLFADVWVPVLCRKTVESFEKRKFKDEASNIPERCR